MGGEFWKWIEDEVRVVWRVVEPPFGIKMLFTGKYFKVINIYLKRLCQIGDFEVLMKKNDIKQKKLEQKK